jgi:hypothetical protein
VPEILETETVSAPEQPPEPVIAPVEKVFDPGSISHERFEKAKLEVQSLIEDLNKIIRARNYDSWTGYLAEPYFVEINSRTFLEGITVDLYKRDQIVATSRGRDPKQVEKRVLRTARDYFDYVVVPSRSNDHVDDIDFVTENRVKAYTLDAKGNRLVLYALEIIGNKWKIIG